MAEVWDATKPPSGGPWLSGEIRQNARSIERWNPRSLARDPLFLDWVSAGVPLHWAKSGTGATVTQCGPAKADTTEFGLGGYTAKLAYGSALARLYQTRIASLPTYWRGKQFSLGAMALASSINTARLFVDDGVDVTYSDYISATTAGWVTVVHEFNAAATQLVYGVELTSGSVYLEGATPVFGPIPPQWFIGGDDFYALPVAGPSPCVIASSVASVTKSANGETFYTITVPGNTLKSDGDRLRLTLYGYSANAAVNIYVYPQFGATALAFTQNGSGTNVGVLLRTEIQRLSATTQFMWGGQVLHIQSAGSSVEYTANASPAETLANDVSLTIKLSATGTRSTTVYGYVLEYVPAAA